MKLQHRFIVLGAIGLSLLILGYWLGERQGLVGAFLLLLLLLWLAFFYAEQRLVRRLQGTEIAGQDAWGLLSYLADISQVMPTSARQPPQIYVFPTQLPYVVAVYHWQGRGKIFLSAGLMEKLSAEEQKAALCLGLGQFFAASHTLRGLSSLLVAPALSIAEFLRSSPRPYRWYLHLLGLPLFCTLRLFTWQRTIFASDLRAAQLCGSAQTVARTLWKLQAYAETHPFHGPLSATHLFVVNPLTKSTAHRYLQVQPPTEERIRRLIGGDFIRSEHGA